MAYDGFVLQKMVPAVTQGCSICEKSREERLQREEQKRKKHKEWMQTAPLMELSIAEIAGLVKERVGGSSLAGLHNSVQ